ncbi:MAG: RNA degradosome polyphosphate kinase [Actinobacteria bacterium]|nr:RNA degradosome polyphosphate kinase [Actinomycetota bacterium]
MHGVSVKQSSAPGFAESSEAKRTARERFLNRELSWIDFNERVLSLAEEGDTPLLERLKFLAIFSGGLDEFYMVRVAGLKRQVAAGLTRRSPDGMTARQQLAAISTKIAPLVQRHARLFSDELVPALADAGVSLLRWRDLDEEACKQLDDMFEDHIFPVLTPLAVDSGHPFPYISNLSLNLSVLVKNPATGRTNFARVKVPPVLPGFVELTEGGSFVPVEDVIAAHLDRLFPGMEVVEHHAFRVTRNADLEVVEDGAEDLLQALEESLRRQRFSPAVRLEIEDGMPPHILDLLTRELQVHVDDVHSLPGPLDLSRLWNLYSLDRPDLKDEPFQPLTHPSLVSPEEGPADVLAVIRDQDVLLHHPYESFDSSFGRFIAQAAEDPNVLAIKQTLYRTSGKSPIVDALIEAAQAGKQVVVLVEIKARFDELANINWARTLERAGCHVVYGLIGLKTHCKLCLVVREEGHDVRRYVHFGTGNYNPRTARVYEDLGLLTTDPDLGADVTDLFNYLTGYSRQTSYRSLIVSPHGMRKWVIEMIEREANASTPERPGRIIMKVNNLVDTAVIDALYAASEAGVDIQLILRRLCGLRPGVEGLSSRIEVRSILGRFLEHSRIFYFGNGGRGEIYIGSADLMERNLDRRVEALVKIKRPDMQERLESVLRIAYEDNMSAWTLCPDGTWRPPERGEPPIALQDILLHRVVEAAD